MTWLLTFVTYVYLRGFRLNRVEMHFWKLDPDLMPLYLLGPFTTDATLHSS